jgi:hypothetical protein
MRSEAKKGVKDLVYTKYNTSLIYIGNNGAKDGAGICQADGGGARLAIRTPKVLFNTKCGVNLLTSTSNEHDGDYRVCAS